MKLSFWLAGSKLSRAGLAPIYAKISVNGKKSVNISTGLSVQPDQWVPGGYGHVTGPEKWSASCNEKLLNIRAEIQGIYNDLERRKQVITPQVIKDLYTGAYLSSVSLKSAMFRYIEERQKEKLSAGTLKTMRIRCQNVVKYLVWRKCEERELIETTVSFLADLETYLKTECDHSQSHINKILRFVKAVMDFGVRKEWLEHNPLLSFQVKKLPRKQKVYLTLKELDKIRKHRYASWRLEKIAKLFLFQCYTGLAYAELMRFNKSWLRPGVDDRLWIFADRQKVEGSACQIPLFKPAAEILSDLQDIPQISNGKYNAYLKEIGVIVGIEKNLTTHVARKTFGNLLLDKGVSLEVVSSMYGHSNTKTTLSYYVDISEKRISDETVNLKF
jgi:site-specific recombinase XerD